MAAVAAMLNMELIRSETQSLTVNCFLHDVFPDLYMFLKTYLSAVFEYFIMSTTSKQCKEFHVIVGGKLVTAIFGNGEKSVFRNPTLVPIQVVGILIGGIIGNAIDRGDGMSAAYSWAFINFAGMNLASIVSHSLTLPDSTLWSVGVDIDVAFTGASCICLLLAALNSRNVLQTSPVVVKWIAPFLITLMLLNSYTMRLPFAAEVMYMGSLLVAAVVLLWHYTTSYWHYPMYMSYMSVAIGGAAIAVSGVIFEDQLCELTTGAYTSVPAIFLGCCVAFMSVFLFSFNMEARKIKKIE